MICISNVFLNVFIIIEHLGAPCRQWTTSDECEHFLEINKAAAIRNCFRPGGHKGAINIKKYKFKGRSVR